MKKIFGGIKLTWKKIIISAIVIGITVGLLNSIPALYDTTITDVATYFDFWILCGIFIIMNSKSNKDSALKCFVFFLISQPLIYLAEVPFKRLGWQIFVYYKPWFIWTLLTIPMGYIGYYIKKNKWYGLLILTPILVLLATSIVPSLGGLIYSFPHHLINLIFVIATLIIYPLYLFKDKKLKYIGLAISIILIIIFGIQVFIQEPVYETTFSCNGGSLTYNDKYKAYLKDSDIGELTIYYDENVKDYCLHAKFRKSGDTKVVLESPEGEIKEYSIHIGKYTYNLDDEEEIK